MLLLERPHFGSANHDCPQRSIFTHQRDAQNRAMTEPDCVVTSARELLPGILLVVDMNRLHVANRPPCGGVSIQRNWFVARHPADRADARTDPAAPILD